MRVRTSSLLTRLLSLGAGLPLVVSCSLISLFYEQFPRVASGRLDDAFDLNRAQKADLRKDLEALLEWHRQEELPRYEKALTEFDARLIDSGMSAEDVTWAIEQVENFRHALMAKIYEESPPFLRSLNAIQIDHFEKTSTKRYKERFEALEDPIDEYIDNTSSRWEDRLENWTGSLNKEQKQILRNAAQTTRADQILKRDQILSLHQGFLTFLREERQNPEASIIQRLWELTPPSKGTPLQKAHEAMMIQLAQSLTTRQLARFRKELQDWKEKVSAASAP